MSTLKAARADNFYIPSGWDPSQGSRNQFSKARALRSHNKKYKNGVPCIRFEVPFHIRCKKCENMIAKGVRFNSEKRTIGQFHSTKILEFTFACSNCGNRIKVETDPENCDYKFTDGAYRILNTEKATDMQFIEDPEEILNPLYRLESKVIDEQRALDMKPKIDQIQNIQERMKNDFDINQMMRKKFKQEKVVIEEENRREAEIKNFALPLHDLNEKELAIVKSQQFKRNPAAYNLQDKKLSIMSSGIFESSRNKELEELYKKIQKLPQGTRKALKVELKNNTINKQQDKFVVIQQSNNHLV